MEDKIFSLNIVHLFPDLLNLYGDRGNIAALEKRLAWRGMKAEIKEIEINDEIDLTGADIVIIGGGSDREQALVCEKLRGKRDKLVEFVESNGVMLAVCGGYQMLGKTFQNKDKTIKGLEILDIVTENAKDRLTQNVIIETELCGEKTKIIGFTNHSGRTYLGDTQPFGKVIFGYGNNEKESSEGAVYKNVLGTYLHGPLLPKNPCLTDYILSKALERKYGHKVELLPLDDKLEEEARSYCIKRFLDK